MLGDFSELIGPVQVRAGDAAGDDMSHGEGVLDLLQDEGRKHRMKLPAICSYTDCRAYADLTEPFVFPFPRDSMRPETSLRVDTSVARLRPRVDDDGVSACA